MTPDERSTDLELQNARNLLGSAGVVTVFTGAGMSAESGIPTFRGNGGLWQGMRPEELATPQAFMESPETVREFYHWRREVVLKAEPHAGHLALGKWASSDEQNIHVITQNVDGLHQRSRCPRVLELHGTLWSQHCHKCLKSEDQLSQRTCSCGGPLRPSVVWFGESLPENVWIQSEEILAQSDVVLVVGTSGVVYPAAGLLQVAHGNGAQLIEVNPEPVLASTATVIRGTAAGILPDLLSEL